MGPPTFKSVLGTTNETATKVWASQGILGKRWIVFGIGLLTGWVAHLIFAHLH